MPRKKLQRDPFFPYHVYNRSIDQVFYPVDLQAAWNLASDLLYIVSWMYGAKIHAFVLMSNHFHLFISTPRENLDDCMRYFQSNFSQWMLKKTGRSAYCFEKRYNYSMIQDPNHYASVYRYIYQNPIRAKIVGRAEEYAASSLRGRVGLELQKCPSVPHEFEKCFSSIENNELDWINQQVPNSESSKVRLGLRRRIYTPPSRPIPDCSK
jgi:putative transposase